MIFCRGDVLWTTARYQYGDEIFVAAENYGYVCERDLQMTSYSTEHFVIQSMSNIGYRCIPNNKLSAKIDNLKTVMKGVVVDGSISIKAPNGVTYYYVDGLHRGFVFDRFDDGQIAFKKLYSFYGQSSVFTVFFSTTFFYWFLRSSSNQKIPFFINSIHFLFSILML